MMEALLTPRQSWARYIEGKRGAPDERPVYD